MGEIPCVLICAGEDLVGERGGGGRVRGVRSNLLNIITRWP